MNTITKNNNKILFSIILINNFLLSCTQIFSGELISNEPHFDQRIALQHLKQQVEFGPRVPGSAAHSETINYIVNELKINGWETEIQEFTVNNQKGKNVIGKWGADEPWVILGAHYDSRLISDREPDPNKIFTPVPGANDGASGVAVLLELARVLPELLEKNLHQNGELAGTSIRQIWLVFFDLEDNGEIPGYDWILGSESFVKSLNEKPSTAIIVDMIGDTDLDIYIESNSNRKISEEIWDHANDLGYGEEFIPQIKYSIIDDHIPFLENGIDAVDIIDFDYAYWHTTQDTLDKVSSDSLKAVGDTVLTWIVNKRYE